MFLLPDDPKRALEPLERANDLGFSKRALNASNRLFALLRLGRGASGLELAAQIEADWISLAQELGSTYVWDMAGGDPICKKVENTPHYVLASIQMTVRQPATNATPRPG